MNQQKLKSSFSLFTVHSAQLTKPKSLELHKNIVFIRNRKLEPCCYRIIKARVEALGEQEMLWEHKPVFPNYFPQVSLSIKKSDYALDISILC